MAEILIPGNPGFKSKAGRYGGTYVNEPLSYAYAAWISAEYHAAVIEAFTALAIINMKKAIDIVRSYAAHCCPCRKYVLLRNAV